MFRKRGEISARRNGRAKTGSDLPPPGAISASRALRIIPNLLHGYLQSTQDCNQKRGERIPAPQKPKAAPEPTSPPEPELFNRLNTPTKQTRRSSLTKPRSASVFVQAPPIFTKLPRGAKKIEGAGKSNKALDRFTGAMFS
ncbi:hypothetical protein M422DRAFT_272800 [Sphaerobolus stellatus SS14]|uniref:Uncharacterized protein n=1 Tax=Sphaerobolus stellatus (strain SS14) TaxID=990650 RepID=A0A0C9UAQ2_SPHS4|nr:hypothetical protein M422DRAFT_272800 [Sphaerobolus stellatus SS14]